MNTHVINKEKVKKYNLVNKSLKTEVLGTKAISQNTEEPISNEEQEVFEKCVCCNKLTNIPENMNVEYRSFYIEGAGQLCYDCFHSIYILNTKKTV